LAPAGDESCLSQGGAMTLARKSLLLAIGVLLVLLATAGAALAAKPNRVMIVVMDQMQPGYAQKYDMKNVLWLQKRGVNFPNAWAGQMASETVVSHNTMVSGLFPKNMGWSDEAIRDVDNILGYGENAIVTVGDLGYADYVKLINAMDYPKLGDYLHDKYPDKVVANVGEKGYQVESMAASSSDYWVRMGSKKDVDPAWGLPWTGKYRGVGGNAPDYIKNNDRYKVSVGNTRAEGDVGYPGDYYGTKEDAPAWRYPEDGRYVAGPFADHLSGDTWVADAAIDIINNEDWSGLWVTFSAIDKVGHLWGCGAVDTLANYHWTPGTLFEQVHMPWAAKTADDQLGRVIKALKAKGEYDRTLIVVTADHASTYGKHDYGDNVYDGGNVAGWYAGTWWPSYDSEHPEIPNTAAGPTALKPLMDTGKVEFSYQSTAIETWLKMDSRTWADRLTVARAMRTLPGVIATYIRHGDHYVLHSTGKMTTAEKRWWKATGQHLVDTMAFAGSADVVGLLADKTVYAAYGDHGGAQKDVQRIPMAFWVKGMKHRDATGKAKLADIMPTILKAMGIRQLNPMDGAARGLGL
jgi:hypothetical protein